MDLLLVSFDGPSEELKKLAIESFESLLLSPSTSKLPSHALYTILSYGVAFTVDGYSKVLSEVIDPLNRHAPEYFAVN